VQSTLIRQPDSVRTRWRRIWQEPTPGIEYNYFLHVPISARFAQGDIRPEPRLKDNSSHDQNSARNVSVPSVRPSPGRMGGTRAEHRQRRRHTPVG